MSDSYFSERELGPKPRVTDEIGVQAWGGIIALIETLVSDGFFGKDFSDKCPDGHTFIIGTDVRTMSLALQAEIPDLTWPLREDEVPPTLVILDLIEFCHQHVAKPTPWEVQDSLVIFILILNVKKDKSSFDKKSTAFLRVTG